MLCSATAVFFITSGLSVQLELKADSPIDVVMAYSQVPAEELSAICAIHRRQQKLNQELN